MWGLLEWPLCSVNTLSHNLVNILNVGFKYPVSIINRINQDVTVYNIPIPAHPGITISVRMKRFTKSSLTLRMMSSPTCWRRQPLVQRAWEKVLTRWGLPSEETLVSNLKAAVASVSVNKDGEFSLYCGDFFWKHIAPNWCCLKRHLGQSGSFISFPKQ